MRDLRILDQFRSKHEIPKQCLSGKGKLDPRYNGAFGFKIDGVEFFAMASIGKGWEHVSVSTKTRTPTWNEMEKVKRMFFEDDEVCMQLHVAVKDHINFYPFALHIWRPTSRLRPIPLPPKDLV